MRHFAIMLAAFAISTAQAAEPIRIGITTILSGPTADRGQSEQYGAQIALDQVNEAGGVLGRPVEAFYADNACDPKVGVPATKRLLEQEHVPVLIGALCTPVTHAIMPVVAAGEGAAGHRDLRWAGFRRCVGGRAAMRMPGRRSPQRSISRAGC